MTDIPLHGRVTAPFQRVKDSFAQSLSDGTELGLSFAVYHRGELIVDLYGGYADKKQTRPWHEDTLACVYSSGKAVTALLVAMAVEAGALDYDKPLADVWPEFGAEGKEAITLGQVLSHQAGLPGFGHEVSPAIWVDWHATCTELAGMKPLFEPGTGSGYHAQTFGYLAGEAYRRATGTTIGAALREKTLLEGPGLEGQGGQQGSQQGGQQGAQQPLDIYCGMSEAEQARTCPMTKPPAAPDLGEINEFTRATFLQPWSAPAKIDRSVWLGAEIPASNMHATAKGLAGFLHPLSHEGKTISSKTVLSKQTLEAFSKEYCQGPDMVLPFTLSWAAGMMRNINRHFGPNENALGHAGFGGSSVVVDPDHGLSIAYVMNRMSPYLVGDPRSLTLINCVYECLPG